MIDLRITAKHPEELIWQKLLKEWCAAHKVTQDVSLVEPELHQGNKVIKGITSIDRFLKEYKLFMDDWYDCRCDKWTNDSA